MNYVVCFICVNELGLCYNIKLYDLTFSAGIQTIIKYVLHTASEAVHPNTARF